MDELKNGWQPLDTAPKDGTEVLGYGRLLGTYGYTADEDCHDIMWSWDGVNWRSAKCARPHSSGFRPLGWQPLPSPPAAPIAVERERGRIKYVLHPGAGVTKIGDRARKMNAAQLATAYGVAMEECEVFKLPLEWSNADFRAEMARTQHLIRLYPTLDGRYVLPESRIEGV